MASKDLQQLDLLAKRGARPAQADPISLLPMIKQRPTLLRAIHLAQEVSGLEDKQIYDALGIDASHWTRIKGGTAHFPADERFVNYLNVVGNDIPIIWAVESRGYDWSTIRKHRDDRDRRIQELESQLAEERQKNQIISEFVRETRGRG